MAQQRKKRKKEKRQNSQDPGRPAMYEEFRTKRKGKIRVEGASRSGTLGDHIDRTKSQKHTYPHADPARQHLNKTYMATEHCRLPLEQAIGQRIQEGYSGKKEIRKDAIKYMTTIFTGTHERMTELAQDLQLLDKWVQANYAFVCKEFRKANIVRFVLHMDEKTPHLHCVTVPLTQDGRLSAKEIMGNPEGLTGSLGPLRRGHGTLWPGAGDPGTRKDHNDLYAYYGHISQLEAHSEVNRPKVTHKDAVLNIGKINELLGAQHDLMSAVKLEHEKMKARVANLEQANKRKEEELEKQKYKISPGQPSSPTRCFTRWPTGSSYSRWNPSI